MRPLTGRLFGLPPAKKRSAYTRAILGAACFILSAATATASCLPSGSQKPDNIVCTGTDTTGVVSGNGSDTVTVMTGAQVDVQGTPPATSVTAIDTGNQDDTVINSGGISASFTADTASITSLFAASYLKGKQLYAIGIDLGNDNDTLDNQGTLAVTAILNASPQITASTLVASSYHDETPWPIQITAKGVVGGNGKDVLLNAGSIAVTAQDNSGANAALAVGIESGNGKDVITNNGALTITASSTQPVQLIASTISTGAKSNIPAAASVTSIGIDAGNAMEATISNNNTLVVSSTADWAAAQVLAQGIRSGNGKDEITNNSLMTVTAQTSSSSSTWTAALTGGDELLASTTYNSQAIGIDSGNGGDTITNNNSLLSQATSELTTFNAELNLADTSHADTSVTLLSNALGISSGNARDTIINNGSIQASATSHLGTVNIEVNGADAGLADSANLLDAKALGISTGSGDDTIKSIGSITATATSTMSEVGVNVSYLDITIADRDGSDTSSKLYSTATGIDSGSGNDTLYIDSSGTLAATALSDIHSVGVSIASEGVPSATESLFLHGSLANVGLESFSDATGIVGGQGNDEVTNLGTVNTQATAKSSQVGVNVGIALINFVIPTPGLVLGGGGTSSEATAIGFDLGQGQDQVNNTGSLTVGATSNASATVVSVNLAELSIGGLENVPGLGAAVVASDTTTTATSNALGITAGDGNDVIDNAGTMTIIADAHGSSTSASAGLGIKIKEGDNALQIDAILARAETQSSATATGISGDDGQDQITNRNTMTITSLAETDALAIGIDITGTLKASGGAIGATLTDTSSTSTSTAVGIAGGDSNDTIVNSGNLNVAATADTSSINVSTAMGYVQKGLVAGVSLGRAETQAIANAIGIDGGAGLDQITNDGVLNVKANGDADSVAVSVTLGGTSQGLAGGAALADGGATAIANATGIQSDGSKADQHGCDLQQKSYSGGDAHSCDGGKDGHGKDSPEIVNNNSIIVNATANTHGTTVAANMQIAKEGVAIGAALADNSAKAYATSIGIAGDNLDNMIANNGDIRLLSNASAQAVSVGVTVEGTATGLAAGAALTDASVTAEAKAVGMQAGAGDDVLINSGHIFSGTTTESQVHATATAIGVSASVLISETGASLGAALADTDATAKTFLTVLDGEQGNDELINAGTIDLQNAGANADAVSVSLNVAISQTGLAGGAAVSNGDSIAELTALGLNGGEGNDVLVNKNSIGLHNLTADADTVSVSLTIAGSESGVSLGAALADATANASIYAIGLSGGEDADVLVNKGSINIDGIKADTTAVGVGVGFTFAENGVAVTAALARSGATSNANATAMDGGGGDDKLINEGTLTLNNITADADAVSVSVGVAASQNGLSIGAGLTDASGQANANVTGMEGGSGDDYLKSNNAITISNVTSDGHATGVSVALAGTDAGVAAGVTIANTGATANANVKGLSGGRGEDTLDNESSITIQHVNSVADAKSVGISLAAAISGGVAGGAALSDASTHANAFVTGLDGGKDDDKIFNSGSIGIDDVFSNTDSTSVSVELGVTSAGVALGASLADTHATSTTDVKGLDGGKGNDWIKNQSSIALTNLVADANAVSVGVTLNATPSAGVAAGVAMTDASGKANLYVTGMDGGEGNDKLFNDGSITTAGLHADAHATGVSVAVQASAMGAAGGASIANTSGTATTIVKGMFGGDGNDLLINQDTIDLQGQAKANALSIGITITASVGLGGGVTITDATTNANSFVAGMDGGAGLDDLANAGTIQVNSNAVAESTTASIGITLAIGGDVTLADAKATANATAVGMYDPAEVKDDKHCGGDSHNQYKPQVDCQSHDHHEDKVPPSELSNDGTITATATASSKGLAISGNLFGYALGETTDISSADAAGIRFLQGPVLIDNTGMITANSSATAQGLSVAVTLGGAAVGDTSTTATALATGIESGDGNDQIQNRTQQTEGAAINVDARSYATGKTVSVGLVGVQEANTTNTANAIATGINSGAGDDVVLNEAVMSVAAGNPLVSDGSATCGSGSDGACAKSFAVSATLAGYGTVDASSIANATAVGINAGAGNDLVQSDQTITAMSLARGRAEGISVTLFGANDAVANTTANASATGMSGDAGRDKLINNSNLIVDSGAETYARSLSITLFGAASASANTTTNANAVGIDGGADSDRIYNLEAGHIDVSARTTSQARASSWTFAGAATAATTLGALTSASGISGGSGADAISNQGIVDVQTFSSLTATGGGNAIFGNAKSGSQITATTSAWGIDAGSDDNSIDNGGQIVVNAIANMLATTTAYSFAGGATTSEFITANATAAAIAADAGQLSVNNTGVVNANITASARTQGSSSASFAGGTKSSGTVAATVDATGVDNRTGSGKIFNQGDINVLAIGQAWATHSSSAGVFFSDGGVVASSTAHLSAYGLIFGQGDNLVNNSGNLDVQLSTGIDDYDSDGSAEGIYARARADGGDFDIFLGKGDATGKVTATGNALLYGVALGDGDNQIENSGRISVHDAPSGIKATAYANPTGGAVTVDGDGWGEAYTTLTVDARAISSGDGQFMLDNSGQIDVSVAPTVFSRVDAVGGSSGDADVFVDARVTNHTVAISAGSGEHAVTNSGSISVSNAASAAVYGYANGQGIDGDGRVGKGLDLSGQPGYARVDALTAGIDLADGASWVKNAGTINLSDDTHSKVSAYADSDFGGGANGFARAEIASDSYAIRTVGAGSVIKNSGSISISATPDSESSASGMASGDGSRAWGTGLSRSQINANVYGIQAQGDNSAVWHNGSISIDAHPDVSAVSNAESNLDGDSNSRATALANFTAMGIETIGAGSMVAQQGAIDISIDASGDAYSKSHADGALAGTRAYAISTVTVNARGVGMHVAHATGEVSNEGDITVATTVNTATSTNTEAPGLPKGVEDNYSTATADAFGVWADTNITSVAISNVANISVAATSTAQASAVGSTYMDTQELALSHAIGILGASEANNEILNTGTIHATAVAASDNNDAGKKPVADAIGIRTGSGNDTIINRGTIETSRTLNGVTSVGTAIDAGAGNDTVILGDASVTNGDIDLGSGSDTLSMEGTPVINGSIIDELSSLTLAFNNSGSYAGSLPGYRAVKNGVGTFTLSTLPQMVYLEMNQGTLQLNNNYDFHEQGTFQATLYGDGSHGQFLVNGAAALHGQMNIVRGHGAYRDGTTYDVLSARDGFTPGSGFNGIALPEDRPLLHFELQQTANSVQLTSDVKSFTTVATPGNAMAVARNLDTILPTVSGELSDTLGIVQTLAQPQEFTTAFYNLSPAAYQPYSLASVNSGLQYTNAINARMNDLHFSEVAAAKRSLPEKPFMLAANGSPQGLFEHAGQDYKYGVFVRGFGQHGVQDADASNAGYDFTINGLIIGFDQKFNNSTSGGISIGSAKNDLTADKNSSVGDIDTTLLSLYGSYLLNNAYVDAVLSYGNNSYTTRRNVVIGLNSTEVNSSHDGKLLSLGMSAGMYYEWGKWWLRPYASLQYTSLDEDGFSESGGGASLIVASRTTNALISQMGVSFLRDYSVASGNVTTEFDIGWTHDFNIDDHVINAAYVAAPDATFSIEGQKVEQNGIVAGAGFSYEARSGYITTIKLQSEFRNNYNANSIIGEFRYQF